MGQQSNVFVKATDVELEDVAQGLTRQVLGYNDDIMLVRVTFEKGAIGERHSHPHRQVTYVESGSFEVEINGEKQVLNSGDSFMIPADLPHGAVCLAPGVLIDVFTPTREDFLNGK